MKMFVPLLALLAVPAAAQNAQVYYASNAWPVQVSGQACSMANAMPGEASNPLTLAYDARSGEVSLSVETTDIVSGLADTGTLDLAIVLLDNGKTKHDDGWGWRSFGYTRQGDVTRFTAHFAGERNVRQLLTDLSSSKHIGLLYRGEVIASTELASIAPSIDKLRECARQTIAAG
ncbi:MAG: hypothetical protein J0I69_13010 [Altererythrobacter sp.]|nr:hypothetical protein [Altererythrobacter sp.]OJU61120.1 MAG: hypothetical protein BGO08_08490 [Altererythrobacter sp. 66-12]